MSDFERDKETERLRRIIALDYSDDGPPILEEDLYAYFKRLPYKDWTGLAMEGRKLFARIFPDIDRDEAVYWVVEGLLSAVANQSAECVWDVVAHRFKIGKEELYDVCSEDYENP